MNTITESDSRAMVRLLGETAASQGTFKQMKAFLMNGLCELIQADAWAWTLSRRIVPGNVQAFPGYIHGGFSEQRFANFIKALEHPAMGLATASFYAEVFQSGDPTTMCNHEMDTGGAALADDVLELWQDADIGPVILSGHPVDKTSFSGLGIYRKFTDEIFSPRDRQIAHIILSEVPWLHLADWPEDRGAKVPTLFPKQRIVFNLLLDGRDRKTIAAHMAISENTVAGYARDIYRHFGVNSQPQLIRRFFNSEAKV
jgi:DNA-binding CsgD family transcriptional regulator